jgi:hypothetical protein
MIVSGLTQSTEEMDSLIVGLNGGFIPLLPEVTYYVMGPLFFQQERITHLILIVHLLWGWPRGSVLPLKLEQHQEADDRRYPETVAVTLWALTPSKLEVNLWRSLSLVGRGPVKGTGRIGAI